MIRPFVALVPGALLLLVLALPGSSLAQEVDFSGSWVLNESESDNPRARFQGTTGSGRQPGMRGRTGARPPAGARGGMSDADREQMRQMMASVMVASETLRVAQDDSTFMVDDDEGTLRVHHLDGRKKFFPLGGVGNVESKAKWDDEKVVVEMRLEGGVRVTKTYELDSERRRLSVRVRMEGGQLRQSMDFRRVYDAVDDETEG